MSLEHGNELFVRSVIIRIVKILLYDICTFADINIYF